MDPEIEWLREEMRKLRREAPAGVSDLQLAIAAICRRFGAAMPERPSAERERLATGHAQALLTALPELSTADQPKRKE